MMTNLVLIFTIVIILIFFVVFIIKFINNKKRNKYLEKENRKLLVDLSLIKLEHLKFQMQPHTLKNVIATLKATSNKLNKGLDALCETLDYILYKGNNYSVSIEEELNFIKKYCALNDLFLTEINSIKIFDKRVNLNSKYFSLNCVPHLITAYFIENAFKHGDLNHPEFLIIEFALSDSIFELKVINKIKHHQKELKEGLGLRNMKKRLDILHYGKYEIKTYISVHEFNADLIIRF